MDIITQKKEAIPAPVTDFDFITNFVGISIFLAFFLTKTLMGYFLQPLWKVSFY